MKYRCPHCGEILDEEEAAGVEDCGCPSCRYYIHNIEDFVIEEDAETYEDLSEIF